MEPINEQKQVCQRGDFDGELFKTWSDNVKRDLGKLQVDNPGGWWDFAQDRDRWRLLVAAAKSHMGPQPLE